MAQKKRRISDWKKKKWFDILAPPIMDRKKIAETVAEKPEKLVGRTISASLRDLLGEIRKQHISLKFRIDNVQGSKAYTALEGLQVSSSYIARLSRRSTSKIQAVQNISSKDGRKAKVKSVTISQSKIPARQKTAIRKVMEKKIAAAAAEKNYDELIQSFVFGDTASNIFNSAKNIAPIKRVEIVKTTVLSPASSG